MLIERNKPLRLLNRDNSLLEFNARVLENAAKPSVPLLERLRFLCIVASNLDEFFEVRFEDQLIAHLEKKQVGESTAKTYEIVSERAQKLVAWQYEILNQQIMPAFAQENILILSESIENEKQNKWLAQYFKREIAPLLFPVSLDPSHPFPQIVNKSLNFIVKLEGKDAFGRQNDIAIVTIPRALARLIQLPRTLTGEQCIFISLSSLITWYLPDFFPGRVVKEFFQFRITRHSDLEVDEDDVKNLRTALRKGLARRHFGRATRLEISSDCSEKLANFLLTQFALPSSAMFRVNGPTNLGRWMGLIEVINRPDLCYPIYSPCFPKQLKQSISFFEQLEKHDIITHQPFENFDGVVEFLEQAVRDPAVLAIKQTIYRTGPKSKIIDLLREAVRRGKEVMVVVELKARFDEEANINWAEELESAGAQVVYGVVGLKTHAKMILITRRENKTMRRYGHLSTGNYNPKTATLYTDISHFTANVELTGDIDKLFFLLASQCKPPKMNQLIIAPFFLQEKMLEKIHLCGLAASKGQYTRIVAKMNSLTDEVLIRALIAAGLKGVKIDLIVRGACTLPAQIAGITTNIRVRSIIGRFLEHSRIFYFGYDVHEDLYLSSADWMNRNMVRRVEVAWPIMNPTLRQFIIDYCLVPYLHDNVDAWELESDGHYTQQVKLNSSEPRHSAQEELMAFYSDEYTPT